MSQFEAAVDDMNSCSQTGFDVVRWISIRTDAVSTITVTLTCGLSLLFASDSDVSLVGLALMYAIKMSKILPWTVKHMSHLEDALLSVESVLQYFNNEREASWQTQSHHKLEHSWPSEGMIEFVNYSCRYRPGLDLAIRGMNLKILAAAKVGIVGRTGAGKSTIASAVLRLVEASEGVILIDDLDIKPIGLHDLRTRITIIPQDSLLMSGTVRWNLDPTSRSSDEEIWHCLQVAHLHDVVSKLPQQLDHTVSEGGNNFSSGQKQLFCLARALLRKSKIVIMDEAMSAVDEVTERLVLEILRREFRQCTVITIAHRLKTILNCDQIIVMDNGRVAETGTPSDLMMLENSMFRSLVQTAGLLNDK